MGGHGNTASDNSSAILYKIQDRAMDLQKIYPTQLSNALHTAQCTHMYPRQWGRPNT